MKAATDGLTVTLTVESEADRDVVDALWLHRSVVIERFIPGPAQGPGALPVKHSDPTLRRARP